MRSGQTKPDTSTPEALKAALLAADAIYFPDPLRATAGIHFADVMRQLGIHDELAPRFRTFPNGATSMWALAASNAPRLIGCTQVTEINHTEGVVLVGALPDRFELAKPTPAQWALPQGSPNWRRGSSPCCAEAIRARFAQRAASPVHPDAADSPHLVHPR